jgi:hypothetical protein
MGYCCYPFHPFLSVTCTASGAIYHDENLPGRCTIIADQEWAIEAIYKVLDRQKRLYYELRT